MHHRLVHRPSHGVTRAGLISSRLLVAVALLLGTMSLGLQGAGAQSGGNFDYDQDGLQWSVSYDDGYWTEGGGSDTADFSLQTDVGSIAQFITLADVNEDPAGCLAAVIPEFEDGAGATDSVGYEDDNGDPVAGETDAYAYEVRTITTTVQNQDVDLQTVHACYALDDMSLVWAVGLVPDVSDAAGDLDATYALFDGISINGEPTPIGLSSGDTSDGTPAASDEGTPVAGGGTPGPADATPAAGGSGADENAGTYVSQSYGYTLNWVADDWTVGADQETSAAYPRDVLQLVNSQETSLLYAEGTDGEWTDTDDCVSGLLDEIGLDVAGADPLNDPETDEPYAISEDGHSAEAYTGTLESDSGNLDASVLVDCRQDTGSDLIVGFTSVSNDLDDYFGTEYPAVADILDSLEF